MIRTALSRSFDWSGRATRTEAWVFFALFVLVILAGLYGEPWLTTRAVQSPRWFFLPLAALTVPMIGVWIRRLHDMGRSGLWVVLSFVPLVQIAAVLWMLTARTNPRRDAPESAPALRLVGGLIVGLLTLLIASRAFWHPYWIPSESMKPTLLIGDYLTASYITADDIQRGDVVVFRHPRLMQDMIARVIALPSETVQMQDGAVVINGQPSPQTPDGKFAEVYGPQGPNHSQPRCGNAPVGLGGQCLTDRAIEILPGGATHRILNIQNGGYTDDAPAITIPPGAFFVLGDNRDNSADSRISTAAGGTGLVPAEAIIARADRVIFSAAGSSLMMVWTWRADRYLMAVE